MTIDRRQFIAQGAALSGTAILGSSCVTTERVQAGGLEIRFSVQQYSANKLLRSGKMKFEDYPAWVVKQCGILGIEYWEKGLKPTVAFAKEIRKRTDDMGASNQLILTKGGNGVDHPNDSEVEKSLDEVKRWSEIAAVLGCHGIRIDVRNSKLGRDGQLARAVSGLQRAVDAAAEFGQGILIENHGGFSSDGVWLKELMSKVDRPTCTTLPDFNNWTTYDRYQGVADMMPWAKVICVKSLGFNADGNGKNTDYYKMWKIIKEHGFRGYVGIEYEAHDETLHDAALLAGSVKKVRALVLDAIAKA